MSKLKEVFFWSDGDNDPDDPGGRRVTPWDCVRVDLDPARAAKLAAVLKAGKVIKRWRGHALCRMPGCGAIVGSSDSSAHGHIWPTGAEHYVSSHNVWPPGADDLLAASESAPDSGIEEKISRF